jgi:hypothetical protein
MLTAAELQRALTGAWLLALRDPRAFEQFDLTVDGFWRSFWAAAVAAPLYLVLAIHEYALTGWPAEPVWAFFVRTIAYILDWGLFPLVALLLVRLADLGHRYVVYIVTNNWATVLQLLAFTASVAIATLLPDALASVLMLAALVLVLAYRWLVALQALATTGALATAFVLVDLVLGLLLDRIARALLV